MFIIEYIKEVYVVKKIKIKIILLILLIIGTIIGFIFGIYKKEPVPNSPNETMSHGNNVVVQTPTPTPTESSAPIPQTKPEDSIGKYTVPDNEQGKALDKTTAKNIETRTRKYFEQFEFEEGLKLIQDAINQYKFEENGKTLEKLYYEASLVTNLKTAPIENGLDIISAITDEELLVLATLYSPLLTRASVICNHESLFPIFTGTVTIRNKEFIADDKLEEIRILYPAVESLCRIEFVIEEEPLFAYVIVYPEKDIALYSFEPTSDNTKFFTLKKYREILN